MKLAFRFLAGAVLVALFACSKNNSGNNNSNALTVDTSVSSTVAYATVQAGNGASGSEGQTSFKNLSAAASCMTVAEARTCTDGVAYIAWNNCVLPLTPNYAMTLGGAFTDSYFSDTAWTIPSQAECTATGITSGQSFQRDDQRFTRDFCWFRTAI